MIYLFRYIRHQKQKKNDNILRWADQSRMKKVFDPKQMLSLLKVLCGIFYSSLSYYVDLRNERQSNRYDPIYYTQTC